MSTRPLLHGGMVVLVLLVTLSGIAIGALSMVSAYSDLKLARAAAERVETYYELEQAANEALGQANGMLASGLAPDGWTERYGVFYHDISLGGQNLHIELVGSEPDECGRYYQILAWRQWQDGFAYETEGIGVWQG